MITISVLIQIYRIILCEYEQLLFVFTFENYSQWRILWLMRIIPISQETNTCKHSRVNIPQGSSKYAPNSTNRIAQGAPLKVDTKIPPVKTEGNLGIAYYLSFLCKGSRRDLITSTSVLTW